MVGVQTGRKLCKYTVYQFAIVNSAFAHGGAVFRTVIILVSQVVILSQRLGIPRPQGMAKASRYNNSANNRFCSLNSGK